MELWLLPILFFILTFFSFFSGRMTARVFGLRGRDSNFVTACTVFQNSNSLPIAMVTTLSTTMEGLEWYKTDTPDAVASRGILYLLIFAQFGQVIRWSYGYRYLLAPVQDETEDEEYGIIDQNVTRSDSDELSPLGRRPSRRTSIATRIIQKKYWTKHNLQIRARSIWEEFLNFMNPPLWSMVISIFVAMVPQLHYWFFEPKQFIKETVSDAITTLGGCAVPLILVILGANLGEKYATSPTLGGRKKENKMVLAALISKLVVVPLICLPLVALMDRFFFKGIIQDPIFTIVLFLLIGSPTAITIQQICQINSVFEKEMARVLWWGYAVITVPSTLFLVIMALETIEWAKASVV